MKSPYQSLPALEERILHGLEMEWKIAIYSLKKRFRDRLKVPGFELRDLQNSWGLWEGTRKNIAISRKLTQEHPWKSVREVLRHEMAHQVAEQIFGETGSHHGKAFRDACRWLGADPAASGTFPSIYETMEKEDPDSNDRIMQRVRKLLAMAQSSNKNEAELAMAKAHEHIARYNIDLLSIDRDRTYCSLCLGEPALRKPAEAYALAEVLRSFYFVQTIWVSMAVIDAGRPGTILEISGTPDNVSMAGFVHAFLLRAIESQWTIFKKQNRSQPHRRTDFALGLIAGFSEKLREQTRTMESSSETTSALMKAGDKQLQAYFEERYPRIQTIGRRGRLLNEATHAAGHAAGRKTILHKPITRGTGTRGNLLNA